MSDTKTTQAAYIFQVLKTVAGEMCANAINATPLGKFLLDEHDQLAAPKKQPGQEPNLNWGME